jgi:mannose-1-phosphate guanylyltransferase
VDSNKTVALVGVENLVIVDTPDALLVANRKRSQDVSKLVKTLDASKREELL